MIAVVVFDGSLGFISKACELESSELFWFAKLDADSTIILKEAGLVIDLTINWWRYAFAIIAPQNTINWSDRYRKLIGSVLSGGFRAG